MPYDVIVIGGGPAGMTAATTIAQQGLKYTLLTHSFGGQLNLASAINNLPTQKKISGKELAAQLMQQFQSSTSTIDVSGKVLVKEIRLAKHTSKLPTYSIVTEKGDTLNTRALILAMGADHNTLGISGEEQLTGKGVSYCAMCDSPYYKNKVVAVLGNGVVAESAAQDLSRIASRVYFFQSVKNKALYPENDNIEFLYGIRPVAILGQDRVTGLKYLETQTGHTREIALEGVFIEAGISPNSESVKHLVKTDGAGQIIVDHQTMTTSELGIFAAGDITDGHHKQVTIAVADGTKAALSAMQYLAAINEVKETRW